MSARYLVRFDDLCPTQNWGIWEAVEEVLLEARVRPLVAIIPDNQDETLRLTAPRADFWDLVRTWQARGWTIGMHGYQHRFVTQERGLYGWDGRSEFAGLPFAEQFDKINRSLGIFEAEGVRPDVWVAPNHSFDRTTVTALARSSVHVISDGLSLYPYVDAGGMTWVPLQLWGFRPRRLGVWTVCLHPNKWSKTDLRRFSRSLSAYSARVTDFRSVLGEVNDRRRNVLDHSFRVQRRTRKAMRTWMRGSRRAAYA